MPAGESSLACLASSQALSKRQAGRTCGTPRMGSPTVANTKERAQTFHACAPSFSFLLSCRVHYFLLHLTMVGDWRGRLTGQGSLAARARCSACLGTELPNVVCASSSPFLAPGSYCTRPTSNHSKEEQSNRMKTLLILSSSEVY